VQQEMESTDTQKKKMLANNNDSMKIRVI